jgi:GDPmannose 4,6-dehydratase
VGAMHIMLQKPEADDYVVATGETHSVREFCELAFGEVGLDYRDFVRKNEAVYRPAEVDLLIGDYSKARKVLGWEPTVNFSGLVKEMVHADMDLLSSTLHPERPVTVSSR